METKVGCRLLESGVVPKNLMKQIGLEPGNHFGDIEAAFESIEVLPQPPSP